MANMYESQHLLATQSIPNQNREVDEEEEEEEEDEGDFEVNGIGGDLSKKPKKNIKRDVDDAVTDEVDRPSFVAELSPRVVETVLQVNMELIRLCVEYQNRGWFQDPDYAIYQARLQSNLIYLASVADYHLKPDKASLPAPSVPHAQLAPISVNAPTALSERINGLLTTARKAQEEQTQVWRTEMERQSRNAFERLHQAERERAFNSTTGITTGHGHADSDQSMALSGDLRKRKRVNEATKVVLAATTFWCSNGDGRIFNDKSSAITATTATGTGTDTAIYSNNVSKYNDGVSWRTTYELPDECGYYNAATIINPSIINRMIDGNHNNSSDRNNSSGNGHFCCATFRIVANYSRVGQLFSRVFNQHDTADCAASGSIRNKPVRCSATSCIWHCIFIRFASIDQFSHVRLSQHPSYHGCRPNDHNGSRCYSNTTHSISNALHPPPTLPISNESTTNQAQDLLTNTDRAGLSPHSQDVNPTGHPHQNNHRQHHNNNNSNNNGNNNSNSNATFASLGNLEAIAAASGLDPTTLGVLSPQALLNAFASSGNEDISNVVLVIIQRWPTRH
ncbi:hypothetical protein BDF19DRAFT_412493 [Syncephalis fuscata]|nr:hypothetical protein BDF19DRAFT_412493 [Syncephalis fuscata]